MEFLKRFIRKHSPSSYEFLKRLIYKLSPASGSVKFRNVLRYYIAGSGIEIGALHTPLDISGLPVTSIKFIDRLTTAEN